MRQESRLQREARIMALHVRAEAGMGAGPIPDIFELLARLDILYLRYPAGDGSIEGFAAVRGGRRIVFTNSSYPRGKENFTAAHELGHLYLDLRGDDLLVDERIERDPAAAAEVRANQFAADFLMPAEAMTGFVLDCIGAGPDAMTAKYVVAIQQYFKVSYTAALIRLKALDLISEPVYERARAYGGYASLSELTRKCGYSTGLGQADGGVHVPAFSLRKVVELYEQDKIPYGSLKYFTELLRTTPEALGFAPGGTGDESER